MFLLYSCDMSGIQNFIYTISGEGALKQLRARSLYLEMLLEHIADELLERLELSRCNLLYTGGGRAYLLLPNTAAAKETLAVFEAGLKAWFIENYKTDLYLASAFVECSADDLSNKGEDRKRYRNLYRSLSEEISSDKVSRYTPTEIIALNFADDAAQDHSRECTECQRSDLNINSEGKCTLCAALGSISPDLINKDVFVVATNEVANSDKLLSLPFGAYLSIYSVKEYLGAQIEARRVYTKNRWDIGVDLATHIWMGDYTADIPRNKDGELQGISAYANDGITLETGDDGQKLGIKRLGVLRADVDDLGTVFSSGLPDDKISISRTSTLSRDLSYFFKYCINKVLEDGRYQAQIIYSGGDDLFVIGNWSDIIQAAVDIRKTLDEFTGNGVLTISAGIGMYDSHYPIARMAAEVGELEDAAKLYRSPDAPTESKPAKNAVTLWASDTVFGWDDFINNILGEKLGYIKQSFDKNDKGKSFIYRMVALLRQHEYRISVPRLAYLLARSFEDKGAAGEQVSHKLFEWASDNQERRFLIAALELYVYGIRERG
jgi:CRISPR-associated protein Csm1